MRTRQKDANDDIQCKCIVYELFRANNTNAEEKDGRRSNNYKF